MEKWGVLCDDDAFQELCRMGPKEAGRALRGHPDKLEDYISRLLFTSCPYGAGSRDLDALPTDLEGVPFVTWLLWLCTSPNADEVSHLVSPHITHGRRLRNPSLQTCHSAQQAGPWSISCICLILLRKRCYELLLYPRDSHHVHVYPESLEVAKEARLDVDLWKLVGSVLPLGGA